MFLVSISYKVDLSQVDNYLAEHVAYLEQYYQQGVFVLSGPKIPREGGVILVRVDTRQELDLILEADPFYRANLAAYEVTAFQVTKAMSGLEHLLVD